jgi:hypothetical protein|tara:strand:- start:784 stop:1017 length:234 start_codon:yes stop_codon:yes gene_type:complete
MKRKEYLLHLIVMLEQAKRDIDGDIKHANIILSENELTEDEKHFLNSRQSLTTEIESTLRINDNDFKSLIEIYGKEV